MDKEMLQKVLDFIREGATTASDPAKWGFDQMCAYRANVALGELITLAFAAIISFVAAFYLAPFVKKHIGMDHNDFLREVGVQMIDIILFIICISSLIAFLCLLPTNLATIHNPAGSVLSELAK
jgi:hypothetical protein